jgi:hypothetical protein
MIFNAKLPINICEEYLPTTCHLYNENTFKIDKI